MIPGNNLQVQMLGCNYRSIHANHWSWKARGWMLKRPRQTFTWQLVWEEFQ